MRAVYRSTQHGAPGTWETRVAYDDANPINTVQLTNPVYAFLGDCGFGPENLPIFNQGWYDNQIAVDPKDENIVWTAGIDQRGQALRVYARPQRVDRAHRAVDEPGSCTARRVP